MSPGLKNMAQIARKQLGVKQDVGGVALTITRVEFRYRGKGYAVVPCPGSAHSGEGAGYIDHCSLCAPLWGTCVEFLP